MNYEDLARQARRTYGRSDSGGASRKVAFLSSAPPLATAPAAMAAGDFVDRLLLAAFETSPKLYHPFAIRLARGEWSRAQLQEWVRQEYQHIVVAIRRHAQVAANASEYEDVWALITRVKVEADADPVGGVFFALPQLWLKFGIALGLEREQIVAHRPHPLLTLLNQAMLDEVRFSGIVPVSEFVHAFLDPVFHRLWGDALENSLHLPSSGLDYFWAMAGTRWAEETGRPAFQRQATPESQPGLWSRYAAEPDSAREWQRYTLLQQILESVR